MDGERITPEERSQWRRSKPWDLGAYADGADKIYRLLDALDATEAALRTAREEANALDAEYGPIRAHLLYEGKSFGKIVEERDEARAARDAAVGALAYVLVRLQNGGYDDEADEIAGKLSVTFNDPFHYWDDIRAAARLPATPPIPPASEPKP